MQDPGSQIVPRTKLRQAPAPSHVPSRPQVEGSEAGQTPAPRGAPPAGTNAQDPGAPAVLQDLHVSVHALLQQTPSTQNPLAQSPAHPHAAPLAPFILLVPLQATVGASPPPSWTDPSARSAVEWLLHPAAKRPTHPTATAPKSRAARKLIISRNVSPRPLPARRELGCVRSFASVSRGWVGAFAGQLIVSGAAISRVASGAITAKLTAGNASRLEELCPSPCPRPRKKYLRDSWNPWKPSSQLRFRI